MAERFFYEPLRDVAHNLDCNLRSLATSILPHYHQAVEISCILQGEIEFRVGEKSRLVTAGDITFVPPYVVHSSSTSDCCDAAVLIIPHRYFADFEAMMGGDSFSFLCDKQKNTEITRLICELAERQAQGRPTNEVLLRSYAERVLGLIADGYEAEPTDTKQHSLVMQIIEYVEENCAEGFSLAEIAAHFGYSKYHFSRLFHAAFHCSLPAFVNAVRVRRVESADADRPKSERILDAGFGSLSGFYRSKK